MPLVYVNGALLDGHDAAVSAFDHGVVVGDGAFETVLLHSGRPFALRRHLARLNRSLAGLSIDPADVDELRAAVDDVVASCDFDDGRIRITVTAGPGPLGSARDARGLTRIVACSPLGDLHDEASVCIVPWPRNERGALRGLKTISYAENAVALAYAAKLGADEAIFANTAGHLCEGSGSNVFLVIDGELVTPPLTSGCLAGITRALVLEHATVATRDIPAEWFRAERLGEAFLTSAIRGVQPITRIDGQPLARGPVAAELAAHLSALRSGPEP